MRRGISLVAPDPPHRLFMLLEATIGVGSYSTSRGSSKRKSIPPWNGLSQQLPQILKSHTLGFHHQREPGLNQTKALPWTGNPPTSISAAIQCFQISYLHAKVPAQTTEVLSSRMPRLGSLANEILLRVVCATKLVLLRKILWWYQTRPKRQGRTPSSLSAMCDT